MKFDEEFKKAISQLASNEKDKLILRLLKYDFILAERLAFELLAKESVEERRDKVKSSIKQIVNRLALNSVPPKCLLSYMRYSSGDITQHVKITKDKYGEVSLNLFMLNEFIRMNIKTINSSREKDVYAFGIYVIARAFKILILIKTMHKDFLIEFEDDLKALANNIIDSKYLMRISINNGLDMNWLSQADIPDDIKTIHKEIKDLGLLK